MVHWPYRISVEFEPGKCEPGFGIPSGVSLDRAREYVEDEYEGRRYSGLPTVSIALMQRGKIVDVFLCDERAERAKWQSQYRQEAS